MDIVAKCYPKTFYELKICDGSELYPNQLESFFYRISPKPISLLLLLDDLDKKLNMEIIEKYSVI